MFAETNILAATLHEKLASCSKLIEAGDYSNSEQSIAELVNFLNSISNSLIAEDHENEDPQKIAIDILTQIHQYMASPAEIIDALAFELPKAVARFACVSTRCLEVAEDVVDLFVGKCSPRDMLSILCEVYEELEYEDTDYVKLFCKAAGIAYSIRAICVKLALVSVGITSDVSGCLPLVLDLSDSLQHCELSYIGLITGFEVAMISKLVLEDDREYGMDCFSQVKLGAALAVIWGYMASEVAIAAKADLTAVIMELQGNWTKRWEAIGMLSCIFSCAILSWELKQHGIRFLLCIMDGIISRSDNDHLDYSMHMPTLYTSLQAIEMVIMYASSSELRKNAFSAFKKVLADIPTSVRFDVLKALINNSDSSSMIGILLDCVKEEMRMGKIKRSSSADAVLNSEVRHSTSFWNPSVLELVEEVLRPPKGGPPSLSEYSDAVLSALNLYRFILITESTGNSNCTGILSKDKLQKAYNEWLLPLRTLVTRTTVESHKGYDDQLTASDMICALNPIELVLYRCIELVEEKLKHL
ncbi:hypothetical protein DH2020_004970 [Rehmannia glutinosa]|uniref:Aberrant root formation protein n=1 Tax=Rehmannia glutinosa TaxID=99300 RepID=A0ABR0XR40_REHGL